MASRLTTRKALGSRSRRTFDYHITISSMESRKVSGANSRKVLFTTTSSPGDPKPHSLPLSFIIFLRGIIVNLECLCCASSTSDNSIFLSSLLLVSINSVSLWANGGGFETEERAFRFLDCQWGLRERLSSLPGRLSSARCGAYWLGTEWLNTALTRHKHRRRVSIYIIGQWYSIKIQGTVVLISNVRGR